MQLLLEKHEVNISCMNFTLILKPTLSVDFDSVGNHRYELCTCSNYFKIFLINKIQGCFVV